LKLAVGLLFLLSGLSSLVLETVWVRMMVLVFGSTTFAVSTVLTAFMGGLALGGWIAGRRGDRLRSPGRAILAYGVLELCVGLYALAMPALVRLLPALHAALWSQPGGASSYYSFAVLRLLLAGALLVLPTVAMGATLPVLARFFCAGAPPEATGRMVGGLYAVNTAGAVLGVLLAGFVLLPRVGLWATNLAACLLDLGLAGAALLIYRLRASGLDDPLPPPGPEAAVPGPRAAPGSRRLAWLALVAIGVSGAMSMAYEVTWTRVLSLVIGSSTYAFSLILSAYLVGLAAGAALYARRQARHPQQVVNLSLVHLLAAATSLSGVLVMDRLPVLLLGLMQQVELSPAVLLSLKFLVAGLIILLPTLFLGMVFPATLRLWASRGGAVRGGASRATGAVYSVNTLGAILGSFAGGFVLVPVLGLQRSLLALVMVGLALAALLGAHAPGRWQRLLLPALAGVAALAAVGSHRPWDLVTLTSGVFRISRYEDVLSAPVAPQTGAQREADSAAADRWLEAAREAIPPREALDTYREPYVGYAVVDHREGVTTTVTVTHTVDRSLSSAACWVRTTLLVNGKPDASLSVLHRRPRAGCRGLLDRLPAGSRLAMSPSGDAETQVLSGLLPYLLHGGRPGDALVIGWGSGISVGAALQAPLRRVVAVELEREVVAAARVFWPYNRFPRTDPRLQLVNGDGRNYLVASASERRFDIIISEPSNPWMSGCGNLFSREFFQLVRRRLAPGGVFLQWLQAYEISPANVWSILSTLQSVFPSVYVFSPARARSDLLLVARALPGKPGWDGIARKLSRPAVARTLAPLGIRGTADLAARLLATPGGVRRLSRGAPQNTDDNARIEFSTPRDLIRYSRYSSTGILRRFRQTLPDPLAAFSALPRAARDELCWAELAAGGQAGSRDPAACLHAARLLAAPPERPQPGTLEALYSRARPGSLPPAERGRLMGLMGRLEAGRQGREFRALALLLASRRLTPAPWPAVLRRTLGRVLWRCGQHGPALTALGLRPKRPR
jgi:spermidine synthase